WSRYPRSGTRIPNDFFDDVKPRDLAGDADGDSGSWLSRRVFPGAGRSRPGLSNRGTLEPRDVFNFDLQRSLQTISTPCQMRDCRSKGKVRISGDKFLYFSVSLPILLVAEALDRIEARRFARRPDAEQETNGHRYEEPGDDGPYWNGRRQRWNEKHEDPTDTDRQQHSGEAAEKSQRHRFAEKLCRDVASSRT